MQPLTQAQIENIIADVNSPDGLTATYEEIADKIFGPLVKAMTEGRRLEWYASRDALPKHRPTEAEFAEDSARGAYAASNENAKFICGLLLGACGFGAVMLEQSKHPTTTRPTTKRSKSASTKGGKK